MADPGQPTLIENGYTIGYITEAQFRAMPEFSTYVNKAGVPDTKADVVTRANAAYPRAILEFCIQVNAVFRGDIEVPGISGAAGKSWRPGDDGSTIIENLDIAAYGIQTPSHLWHLNRTLAAYLGGTAMVSNDGARDPYSIVNARGGLGTPTFVFGAKSIYLLRRHSAANLSGIGVTMAFAAFVTLDGWNQSPDGSIIAAHMAYDRATKTGASYRLGFELGLGYTSGSTNADELTIYYRHYNGSDVEVVAYPIAAGGDRVSIPTGREVCIAFLRTSTTLEIYLNGLLLSTTTFGGGNSPSPGSAPEMRLLLGGDWDGTRHLNGCVRNVAVWTGAQPTAGHLLDFYRVGSGFSPKGVPV